MRRILISNDDGIDSEGLKKLADDLALIVFMRRCHNGEEPWLARIQKGQLTDKVTLQYLVPNYPRLV